ncbi:MAG TPA: GAF domain-containing SpoIIE family protein phosphatase [Thermoanaerobaculia bacterium]|jgi:sigma-B regulation protein RsbU (phosphoserine phosphatase)|nr:GAF domain-containing SpoIIE family protein phosphatase [Thermoanaerobaculia bacterium]
MNAALLPIPAERQRRLFSLLEAEGSEALFLRETLQLVREALVVDAAAAYLDGEEACECSAHVGAADFPPVLLRSEAIGWPSLQLSGGVLLLSEPVEEELPEPLGLLLALGLRLCRLRASLKRLDFDAKYRGVEREAIYDVGRAITSTLDLPHVSEEILVRAVSLLDARRGALYLLDETLVGQKGARYRLQSTIGGTAREGLALDVEAESADLLPHAHHLMAVSIEVEGERRGVLVVGDKESRSGVGPFPDEDRRALSLFANQAALALEQARLHQASLEKERLEREMELAAQIQQGILPRALPTIAGYEVLGWTKPARHVGGDYWDVVPLPDGRFALLVADVSGKGVSAALLVSTLHSALRLLLARGESTSAMLQAVNQHLIDFSAANKFATLLLAALDAKSGEVRYVNAGHNPGVLLRESGEIERLGACAVPLGLLPGPVYGEKTFTLEPGDLLCLYSDGVTEAASPSEEEFGLERLEVALRGQLGSTLPELRSMIEHELRDFVAGQPQGDDQTVVLLRRR